MNGEHGMLYRRMLYEGIAHPAWLVLWLRERRRSLITLSCIAILLLLLMPAVPYIASAFAGLGGYVSEQSLGNGTGEMLYLGDGTNGVAILGTAPIVSTGVATSSSEGNVVIVTMTMTGNVQDLNGMPRADTWFSWGYTPTAMVYTTTPVTITSTGERTDTINPNAGSTVYYQFHAGTDGTASGSVRYLTVVGSGQGISYWFMNTLLPIIFATIILVTFLLLTRNLVLALLATVIGLVGYYIVLAMVGTIT